MSALKKRRLAAAGAGGLALALMIAAPAYADTSESQAQAAEVTLVGGSIVNTGVASVFNDSSVQTVTDEDTLLSLPGQTVIPTGVLKQIAVATWDGISSACAAVLGAGGDIEIVDHDCVLVPGAPIEISLGSVLGLGEIILRATAIQAECAATSLPTVSGSATLGDAQVVARLLGIDTVLLDLAANPAPNTVIGVPGVLSLTLNEQTTNGQQIEVNALRLEALNAALAEVRIGSVLCGPNVEAPPVPMIPAAGAPIAGGVLAIAGVVGLYLWRRRRNQVTVES